MTYGARVCGNGIAATIGKIIIACPVGELCLSSAVFHELLNRHANTGPIQQSATSFTASLLLGARIEGLFNGVARGMPTFANSSSDPLRGTS